MKRFVLLVLALAMVLGLMACGAEKTPETTAVPETTVAPETAPLETQDPEVLDLVAKQFQNMLESDSQTCSISYDQTGMTINLAMQDCSVVCFLAQQGSEEMKKDWDMMVSEFVNLTASIYNVFTTLKIENYVVCVNLVNEANPDDYLIITVDSELIYDAVNGKR